MNELQLVANRPSNAPADSGVAIRPRVVGSKPAPNSPFWHRERQ
jgi:hypothetical protein